jgi:hypothetical protein
LKRIILTAWILTVTHASAHELCLLPSTHPANPGWNKSINCAQTEAFDNDWIGYSTTGTPCNSGATGCADTQDYLYTISASDTDPFVNTGPSTDTLYLWFVCSSHDGLVAATFDVGGDLIVTHVEPANGFIHFALPPQVVMVVEECPNGPVVAAVLTVSSPISVENSSWGGIKAVYR